MKYPELPKPYSNIYPEEDGQHSVCFSPGAQPPSWTGRQHQPVFTTDQMHEYWAERSPDTPHIVCLCGSTRFYEEFQKANLEQTLLGNIVLSVGYYPHGGSLHWQESTITAEDKVKLDELHKRKIDLCDSVRVLNKNGYIGDSTRSEIEYAIAHNKPVVYLEPLNG